MHDRLDSIVDPIAFIGRAPEQVDAFNRDIVDPYLQKYHHCLEEKVEDCVNVWCVCLREWMVMRGW